MINNYKASSGSLMFSESCEMDTFGVVIDLHNKEGCNLAEEAMLQTEDTEFRNLVNMANMLGNRYVVAAGKFNNKGIFGIFCNDDSHLIDAFRMANVRMEEIGSRTTGWMIKPDACADLLGEVSLQSAGKGGG